MMNWHNITKEEALKILESSQTGGLTKKDVLKRQKKYGLNILETKTCLNFIANIL